MKFRWPARRARFSGNRRDYHTVSFLCSQMRSDQRFRGLLIPSAHRLEAFVPLERGAFASDKRKSLMRALDEKALALGRWPSLGIEPAPQKPNGSLVLRRWRGKCASLKRGFSGPQ